MPVGGFPRRCEKYDSNTFSATATIASFFPSFLQEHHPLDSDLGSTPLGSSFVSKNEDFPLYQFGCLVISHDDDEADFIVCSIVLRCVLSHLNATLQ